MVRIIIAGGRSNERTSPQHFQTADFWQVKINDGDVRLQGPDFAQGRLAIARFSAHDEACVRFDGFRQPSPEDRMVIHNQDARFVLHTEGVAILQMTVRRVPRPGAD